MNMEISGKLNVKLALGINIRGEISGAYQVSQNSTSQSRSLMMTLRQTNFTEEILKSKYNGIKAEFDDSRILTSASENKNATHVVTYIEYGSELHIKCEYEGET